MTDRSAPATETDSSAAPAETEFEPQTQEEFAEIDVDAPQVGIVMGSKSDMDAMRKAADELSDRGILHEVRVMSAHREPDVVADYARNAAILAAQILTAAR